MTNQQERTVEQVVKTYKKANASYKAKILKNYGVKTIERLQEVLKPATKEVVCSKMELSRILLNHPVVEVKVSFQKQVKFKDVFEEIMNTYKTSSPSVFEKSLKNSLKGALEGITREATGFHNSKIDATSGRLYFVDTNQILDKSKSYDNRMILISLNHLNWVEVNKVKYILK